MSPRNGWVRITEIPLVDSRPIGPLRVANDLSEVTTFMTLSANENTTNMENKENIVTIVERNRSQF